jgi:hypothetical protein
MTKDGSAQNGRCGVASTRQVELLELDAAGIHVAEYLTVFPPREVLQRKLLSRGTQIPEYVLQGCLAWPMKGDLNLIPSSLPTGRQYNTKSEEGDGHELA